MKSANPLDSRRPCIATIAGQGGGIIDDAKKRIDVEILEVTRNNRNGLPERIHGRLGLRPGRTYFVTRGSIPRTDTGKTQHGRLKNQYLNGDLRKRGQILFPDY